MENEEPNVEDLYSALGPEAMAETSEEEETTEEASAETEEQKPEEESDTEKPSADTNNVSKQNQAFAKMRTENSAYLKTLRRTAEAIGLDPNMPINQLLEQLENVSVEGIAKSKNIDPAILRRLNTLEERDAEYAKKELSHQVTKDLMDLAQKYKPSEKELKEFVQSMMEDGINPATPGFNMESEYIKRNFDKIVDARIKAAVAAEQERSIKASGASQPSNKQGQAKSESKSEVNSMADFEDYLRELG